MKYKYISKNKYLIVTIFVFTFVIALILINKGKSTEKIQTPTGQNSLKASTPAVTLIKNEQTEILYEGNPRLLLFSDKKESLVNDNEYYNVLKEKIISDGLSAKTWFSNRCNEFWLGERPDGKYYSIERHGYHRDGCPGDPMTSPRYNTFLIDMISKEIFYEDVIKDKVISFEDWAKTIDKE
ncbi:MAG: hypothetical protein WC489_01995 [Patescibacteria group bacterium]